MLARIIGVFLGLGFAAVGHAIYDPAGKAAAYLPPIELGPFAADKGTIAIVLMALGAALVISALLPKFGKKASKRTVTFSEPEEAEPHYETHRDEPMMGGSPQPRPLW